MLDGSFKKSINVNNPLGMKGNLALAFAELLKALWKEDYTFLSPVTFRVSFECRFCRIRADSRNKSSGLLSSSRAQSNTTRKSSSLSYWMDCTRISIGSSISRHRST